MQHKRMQHKRWLPLMILGGAVGMVSMGACAADASESFVAAPGYVELDAYEIEGEAFYTDARFPNMGTSVFMPDADLAAPVRAMLLFESREGVLPHARYRVTYQLSSDLDNPDNTHSQVEITRINLGPAIHADLAESVPAEHLAKVEEFGVGPDVSWRFAMSPLQGMTARIDDVSRKVLSAAEVAAIDCLGEPCNQLDAAEGPQGNWVVQDWLAVPSAYRAVSIEGPDPAYVVDQLLTAMGEDAAQPSPLVVGAPRFQFVVSANAGGQDVMTTGLGRNSVVMDDEIGTVWVRSWQHSDQPGEISQLDVKRVR